MEGQPRRDDIAAQLAEISRQLEALPERIGEATDRRTSFEKMMANLADQLGKVSPEEERRMANDREMINDNRTYGEASRRRANIALVISALSVLVAVVGLVLAA